MQLQKYRFTFSGVASLLSGLLVGLPITSRSDEPATNQTPSVVVTPAPTVLFPGGQFRPPAPNPDIVKVRADNSSPLEWRGDTLYVFNSCEQVWRGEGPDLSHLRRGTEIQIDPLLRDLRLWMESTYRDEKGVLYGWVHNEYPNVCSDRVRTMATGHPLLARIAALKSTDDGKSWKSLGWLMAGRPNAVKCDTEGAYYVGGFGDFSTLVDKEKQYIYIFFTSYVRDFAEQGLAVARMQYADRDQPVGKLSVWDGGTWKAWADDSGHLSPFIPAVTDIHAKNGRIFWGPSIHWNTYLNKYVMVVNHTTNTVWDPDGPYVLFAETLADPRAWSKPVKFMDWDQAHKAHPGAYGHGWYVQIAGVGKGETDKLASRTARLFLDGQSYWQIRFRKPGEE